MPSAAANRAKAPIPPEEVLKPGPDPVTEDLPLGLDEGDTAGQVISAEHRREREQRGEQTGEKAISTKVDSCSTLANFHHLRHRERFSVVGSKA